MTGEGVEVVGGRSPKGGASFQPPDIAARRAASSSPEAIGHGTGPDSSAGLSEPVGQGVAESAAVGLPTCRVSEDVGTNRMDNTVTGA